ncbi:MAG: chorismate mutase [Gemmatimonadetes bacterium]|jgi:chorismate mutase|nr:chorismate mutase [Gemmatimonadota bacterium]
MEMDLNTYRARIDSIDDILLELLNRRLKYALEINQIKLEQGQTVLDSSREQKIMERLQAYNEGPISDEGMKKIFTTIIAESRRLMEQNRNNEPPTK